PTPASGRRPSKAPNSEERSMRQRNQIIVGAALALFALTGCSERERLRATEPTDAPGFLQRGWSSFTSGNLAGALSDFDQAIALDPDLADAYVGQGWARLGLATDGAAMLAAISSFDQANARGKTGPDVDAGRAAARLGAGGSNLGAADT